MSDGKKHAKGEVFGKNKYYTLYTGKRKHVKDHWSFNIQEVNKEIIKVVSTT